MNNAKETQQTTERDTLRLKVLPSSNFKIAIFQMIKEGKKATLRMLVEN